jgi:hypothetical protein
VRSSFICHAGSMRPARGISHAPWNFHSSVRLSPHHATVHAPGQQQHTRVTTYDARAARHVASELYTFDVTSGRDTTRFASLARPLSQKAPNRHVGQPYRTADVASGKHRALPDPISDAYRQPPTGGRTRRTGGTGQRRFEGASARGAAELLLTHAPRDTGHKAGGRGGMSCVSVDRAGAAAPRLWQGREAAASRMPSLQIGPGTGCHADDR